VDSAARCILRDLLAAAEAVGDEDGFRRGGADGGEKYALAESLRDGELIALETEGAGHAATARVEELHVGTGTAEDRNLVGHLHHGFVVAVAVEDDFLASVLRRLEIGEVAHEEFAEEQSLVRETLRARGEL
jgi:hypothetical protein